MRAQRRNTRKQKQEKGINEVVVKEAFKEERKLPEVVPKNPNQEYYIELLNSKQVIIASGSAGSGKSFLAATHAAKQLRSNKINKLIVARPYVQTGRHSGSKPGTSLEKLYPYVRNILDVVEKHVGGAVFTYMLKDGLRGAIEVQEVESIRGRSFDEPSILILEEAQQTTKEEMQSIITRVGEDCQLILTGDPKQKDIHGESGLEWLLSFTRRHNIDVGVVEFTPEDCVRSGFVGAVLRGLEHDETSYNRGDK